MTLAEKIAALRGERKLSQGDLAEKLDVSRQSVSKWETGQAVPELDKIIRLADLFGVSVDQLVRDGNAPETEEAPKPETPKPEAPPAEPEQKVVYIGRRYTPAQTLGIIFIVGGMIMFMLGGVMQGEALAGVGAALAILGLPLLLVKKHPVLTVLWILWGVGYLVLCNPVFIRGVSWNPFYGITVYLRYLVWEPEYLLGDLLMILLTAAYIGISVLTVALPLYTGWLCWKRWKNRKKTGGEPAA